MSHESGLDVRAVADPTCPATPRTSPQHRIVVRVVALGLLVFITAACVNGDDDSASDTETDPLTREEAQAEWDATVLPTLHRVAYSPVVEVGSGAYEVLTITGETVEVWDHTDEGWGRSGETMELGLLAAVADGEAEQIAATDLTGDGIVDLVPEIFAPTSVAGAVLVREPDGWDLAPFADGNPFQEGLFLQGRDLVSRPTVCEPSCAAGYTIERFWTWNGSKFEAVPLPLGPSPLPPSTQSEADPLPSGPTPISPPTRSFAPGDRCEPGDHPDCTLRGSNDDEYRYIDGWSDCVAYLDDEGLCFDGDGDGYAGYPDSG